MTRQEHMDDTSAYVIGWGGYYAVVSFKAGKMVVHACRFRSRETAEKSAARRNATGG